MIDVAHHSLVGDGAAIVAAIAAAPASSGPMLSANRRWAIAIIFAAALASAVSFAIFRPASSTDVARSHSRNVSQQLSDGAAALGKSVASLLGLRSPGERAVGALASLKHKRAPILHERALPKVRNGGAPAGPLAAASQPAVSPDAPANPLFNIFSGPPQVAPVSVAAETLPPEILPGGGGLFIGSPTSPGLPGSPGTPGNPTLPTTPGTPGTIDTPSTPGVPGVPEPETWAMMLLGFALMGSFAGFERRPAPRPASN